MQRFPSRAICCALVLLAVFGAAAHGQQPKQWLVDDANVWFRCSANAQQDAEALQKYELIGSVKQLKVEGAIQQTHIDALRGYSMLESLFLDAPGLNTISFAPLQNKSQLSSLTIRSREFTGESLSQLPKLRKLDVSDCPISSAGFQAIGELHRLRELLADSTGLSDDSLASLQNLKFLTRLSVGDYGRGSPNTITKKGLALLAAHPFLEQLDLPLKLDTPSAIGQLPTLRYLKRFNIASDSETNLGNLSRFAGLEILVINLKTLTTEDVHEIAKLKRLRVLNLFSTPLPQATVAALAGCESLEAFCTTHAQDPQLVRVLVQLPSLRDLTLNSLSAEEAILLQKASLLQSLSITGDGELTERAMVAVAELPCLSQLTLQPACTAKVR